MGYLLIVCKWIILFFLYSCTGWMIEVTIKYVQYHKFINRGSLIGPYCPIYGWGVLTVTVIVYCLAGYESSYGDVFLIGVVACGGLEYLVSWYMEKRFHARWWDYSKAPMNLNGRICIGNLILFGFGSVIVIKWLNPAILREIQRIPDKLVIFAAVTVMVLLSVDNVISRILMNIIKNEIDTRCEDNTEEISEKIHELLKDRHLLLRRINEAYPRLQARPRRLTIQLAEARREAKAAAKDVKKELKAFSADREANLEKAKERLNKAKERLQDAEEKLRLHR